jgi:hypothetical protein
MSNSIERTNKEMYSLFKDPKTMRQAWRSVGSAILARPAATPVAQYDKDGNPTFNSQIEDYTYSKLSKDLKLLGSDDATPTELEMILACQIVKARTDTAAATFVRDTIGAKPVDETKVDAQVNNPYESMTDDELEALAEYRAKKQLQEPKLQIEEGK